MSKFATLTIFEFFSRNRFWKKNKKVKIKNKKISKLRGATILLLIQFVVPTSTTEHPIETPYAQLFTDENFYFRLKIPKKKSLLKNASSLKIFA